MDSPILNKDLYDINSDAAKILYLCFLFGSIILLPILIKLSREKIKEIKNPEKHNSYCLITILMMKL